MAALRVGVGRGRLGPGRQRWAQLSRACSTCANVNVKIARRPDRAVIISCTAVNDHVGSALAVCVDHVPPQRVLHLRDRYIYF